MSNDSILCFTNEAMIENGPSSREKIKSIKNDNNSSFHLSNKKTNKKREFSGKNYRNKKAT